MTDRYIWIEAGLALAPEGTDDEQVEDVMNKLIDAFGDRLEFSIGHVKGEDDDG